MLYNSIASTPPCPPVGLYSLIISLILLIDKYRGTLLYDCLQVTAATVTYIELLRRAGAGHYLAHVSVAWSLSRSLFVSAVCFLSLCDFRNGDMYVERAFHRQTGAQASTSYYCINIELIFALDCISLCPCGH